MLLMGLSWAIGLACLICFILVVIQMFQNEQMGLGIACIVLVFCCGIGGLIAFIYGWINSSTWGIQNIMLVWTACIIANILINIIAFAMGVTVIEIPEFNGAG